MVLMAVFTTFITTPTVIAVYKPAKLATTEYRFRMIERKDPSKQLRLLCCFHSTRNIPSLINLIEASRGTQKREGLRVYAMHLMELSERSSAILMCHKARKNGLPLWKKGDNVDSDHVIVAFETFEHLSKVVIRPTIAISPISSMHEDIISGAERKRVAMILLPFHKYQKLSGHLETSRTELMHVNRRVLEHAPCSVGIFVDRGLGGTAHVSASNVDYQITVLFFGGYDDREALSYAARMAEHPGISITLVRFILDPAVAGKIVSSSTDPGKPIIQDRSEDQAFLADFNQRNAKNESVKYEEKKAKDAAETIEVIKGHSRCNMFVVGRMPEGELAGMLSTKGECPELGPVGSLLTFPDFSVSASVLIVQQYRRDLSQNSLTSPREEDSIKGNSESV